MFNPKSFLALPLAVASLIITSCGGQTSQSASVEVAEETECLMSSAISMDSLLVVAEGLVDDTIVVRGNVRHTCKHSGRKCFISTADRSNKMCVFAGGKIGGFNKELIGSDIAVKGILRVQRISREDVLKAEAELEAMKAQGSNVAGCESELGNIAAQKAYMDLNNQDFYPQYFVEGLDFMECN